MKKLYTLDDILYLSQNLSNLCGIPVRVYDGKKQVALFSSVSLIKDPVVLLLNEMMESTDNLTYFVDQFSWNYCIQKYNDYMIVVGPFRQSISTSQSLMDLVFQLEIKREDTSKFISAMTSIARMPLGSVLQSLSSMNYLFNNEKKTLEDLIINAETQVQNEAILANAEADNFDRTSIRNSTLQIEETITKLVEKGDLDGFKSWIKNAPSISAGLMSKDYIRQQKNTFIVAATIFSRAAIRSGVNYNQTLNLTDDYIYRCENARTYEEITNLNYTLIVDLIKLVRKVKTHSSYLQNKIAGYVYDNMSKTITLDELCEYLNMTKSNLCFRFKKETGTTISQFVLDLKIDASKELLKHTDKSLSSIALYYGFSSQAHYSKVFKDRTGLSPLKYRFQKSHTL